MKTSNNRPIAQAQQQSLTADTIDKFLDNQRLELDIKAKEIELQRTAEQHSFEYSKSALDKEAADRNTHRAFVRQCRRDTYLFVSGLVVVVSGIIGYSLWMGKDEIAMEIIKAIIFLLSGGAGGYAIGSKHKRNDDE